MDSPVKDRASLPARRYEPKQPDPAVGPEAFDGQPWLVARNRDLVTTDRDPCLVGKWLLFVPTREVNARWARVAAAVQDGQLGHAAKVATAWPNSHARSPHERVICVYTRNYEDQADVVRVLAALRALGFDQRLSYKTDRETRSGRYGSGTAIYVAQPGAVTFENRLGSVEFVPADPEPGSVPPGVGPAQPRPWSRREDDQLRAEAAQGLPISEMASRHDRTGGAVESRLRNLGIRIPGIETLEERRENRGVPQSHNRWTEAEEAQLVDEHESGLVPADIAKAHGRTELAIYSRLFKLGCIGREEAEAAGVTVRD